MSPMSEKETQMLLLFLEEQRRGLLIARAAHIDYFLGRFLGIYFCGRESRDDFMQCIIPKLSLDERLLAISGLALTGELESLAKSAVALIRPLQRARNIAAHSAGIHRDKLKQYLNDASLVTFSENFPHGLNEYADRAETALQQLEDMFSESKDHRYRLEPH